MQRTSMCLRPARHPHSLSSRSSSRFHHKISLHRRQGTMVTPREQWPISASSCIVTIDHCTNIWYATARSIRALGWPARGMCRAATYRHHSGAFCHMIHAFFFHCIVFRIIYNLYLICFLQYPIVCMPLTTLRTGHDVVGGLTPMSLHWARRTRAT